MGLLIVSLSVEARDLFRYRDENGNLVLSHTIPNEMVKRGYDIVDEYGRLQNRVEPQLSEAAYQEKLRREKRVVDCEKALDRVRKLYQVEADIDYTEEQGLESIDQSIANQRAKLVVMTSQRADFESEAAQLDIAGQAIPNVLLDNIQRAKAQEKNLQDEIEKRFAQKLELRETNAYDRLVFALQNCEAGLPPLPAAVPPPAAVPLSAAADAS
jgi:hypothetical protein